MKKLTLDLDALVVDSFQTSQLDGWDGTVLGAAENVSKGGATQCGGVETCGGGCPVSAGAVTECGGVQTCGGGCQPTAGGATQCGGVQTCGGCKE